MNGYLVYQAHRFEEERSNGNARKIFMTSLVYLPVLLFFYLYHSRMWNKDKLDNESPQVSSFGVCSALLIMCFM